MELIQFLQQFDFDWLILMMKAITFLGNEEFYLLVLPVLIWCWRKQEALPLAIILLLNFWINYEIKEFFAAPRPLCVGLVAAEHYGFPSGHAQGAMVLWGYLAWAWPVQNKRALYGWLGTLIFFIGLSRIYLGVHFPTDVVGGWSIGFAILLIGIMILKQMKKAQLEFPVIPTAALVAFAGLMLAILVPSPISVRVGGMLAGLVGGLILEGHYFDYSTDATLPRQVVKVAIGVLGVLIIKIGLKAGLPEQLWADWLRYGLMGAWVTLGAPLVFGALKLSRR